MVEGVEREFAADRQSSALSVVLLKWVGTLKLL